MQRIVTSTQLLLLIVLVFPSCSPPGPPATDKAARGNTLFFDVNIPIGAINPLKIAEDDCNLAYPLLYSYLAVKNSEGGLDPDLAVRWTYDRQQFTWTLHLRKDARFHDGRAVTAHDVKYSLAHWIVKKRLSYYSLVKEISVVSDWIVEIRLAGDAPEFLKYNWSFDIMPKPADEGHPPPSVPIGSGPYRFISRDGERCVLLGANDDYYGGRSVIDRIELIYEPSKTKTWVRLLRGETDIGLDIAPEHYEMMRQYEDRFYFEEYSWPHYTLLLYNATDPLFADRRVREALSHAIDRRHIIDDILGGYGLPAAGPMGAGSPLASPGIEPVPYDPERALALLKSAGWTWDGEKRYQVRHGKRFEFTILLAKDLPLATKMPFQKQVARYIKYCLNDVGIQVHLKTLPVKAYYRSFQTENRFQAVLVQVWGRYHTPEKVCLNWLGEEGKGVLWGGCRHPELAGLIRRVVTEKDSAARKRLGFRIDELLASLHPGAFLYHQKGIDVMSRRIDYPFPFTMAYEGIIRLRHAKIR